MELFTPRPEVTAQQGAEALSEQEVYVDPSDLELEAKIEALREFMVRSIGVSAVEGAEIAETTLDPKQADPGVLGDVAFEAIVRGGM